MTTRCQIVIPARLASTRLPEKLLREVGGKSILRHTYEAARRASLAEGVIVAVDDQRIAREVQSFGGRWLMTSPDCPSGTDRIAEVAATMPEIDVFLNVQGDEPEIDPGVIDRVARVLIDDPSADMSTAGTPIRRREQLTSPSCVKIVLAGIAASDASASDVRTTEVASPAEQGRAVYFSRAAVPFDRDGRLDESLHREPPVYWHHLGIYAYRRRFLQWFASQPPSRLEQVECLEQLRAIEAGKKILVARVAAATPGIDTPEDLEAFTRRFAGD